MASKKVIAICQSGGEFVTNKDGSLSYNGGEAYAIDIDEQTKLADFKSEVAEMFNCSKNKKNMVIKYFLPSNKKTPITISKDKDLQRMINFVGDSGTVDVYIMSEEAAAPRNTPNKPASRSSRTAVPKAVNPVIAPVDVPMANGSDQGDVDLRNETPIICTPINNPDEKQPNAAQQWENSITGVDQRFGSINEFREALHKYSIAHGFAYKFKKNDSRRVTVICKAQGCPWRIYASRLATTQLVSIKKMNSKHTCEGAAAKSGHRATRGWVGSIIKEKLKTTPNYKPKDIAEDIKREYGVQLNYSQARRAKKIAREQLQDSFKDAYALLPFFCEKIKETNPGSIATFSTKEDTSFHRLFVSFHASISGFQQGCRPLLFLDSVPVNSKYQGNLLSATAADAEDGIFPVAFGVVDAENEDNWRWFLQELKSAVSLSTEITFIADFQHGIKEALAEVFDKSYHSYCLRRLAEKLIRELKGQFSHEARRLLVNDFYSAAHALTLDGFQLATENIKAISSDSYNWVLQSKPEHWANAFFGGRRYNHTTSNFGQSFYSWVSEAGELPITQMIDVLRGKLMESIYKRRIDAGQWTTKLTPSNEEKLQREVAVARSFQVLLTQGNVFEVRGESVDVVDIDHWDCSCKGWQVTGLPCCHAIAVFECIGKSPYDFCSRYLTTESYRLTYAESIYPVPNVDLPDLDESAESVVVVTPPPAKSQQGRAKVKPTETIDMTKLKLQCSKCKGLGHNKRTCKEP
ncbi:hypothetical protein SLEP1_g21813 [Rubroshorea leprosula]|uniref:SWIM-type domain-containing protein n=1 Tax=Rubroshorea leprosula TaxID=152421 RepID=A0AAV5JHS6_9ROSI|nr:hypothetical protein SLEP1_g21813 [Rubroshorea leprosula]